MSDDDIGLPPLIRGIADLRAHLQAAMEIEHTTIPPYFCALYSIKPGCNSEAAGIIGSVMMQEMLHLSLAANVLNAIGGAPALDNPTFMPVYPTTLPIGQVEPLVVNLQKFSPAAVETFLAIEKPAPASREVGARPATSGGVPHGPGLLSAAIRAGKLYPSIGAFYAAIERGMVALEAAARRRGKTIFTGELARQVGPDYYYDGGGAIILVDDLTSALEALKIIVHQGEGFAYSVNDGDKLFFDQPVEPAHYYRFDEIRHGRLYGPLDTPASGPTGQTFEVTYGPAAVYDMMENPATDKFPAGELRDHARAFNLTYSGLLAALEVGFNGRPEMLDKAIMTMFSLSNQAVALMRNPVPGAGGESAGPPFQYLKAAPAPVQVLVGSSADQS